MSTKRTAKICLEQSYWDETQDVLYLKVPLVAIRTMTASSGLFTPLITLAQLKLSPSPSVGQLLQLAISKPDGSPYILEYEIGIDELRDNSRSNVVFTMLGDINVPSSPE